MPAVLLGEAESADSWSSWRWTGSNTYHRSWEQKTGSVACKGKSDKKKKRGGEGYLDRVEPAERRKRDEQEDSTCGPLGKRVALCGGITFVGYRGVWGYRLYASHFDKLVSWSEDALFPGEPAISRAIVRFA